MIVYQVKTGETRDVDSCDARELIATGRWSATDPTAPDPVPVKLSKAEAKAAATLAEQAAQTEADRIAAEQAEALAAAEALAKASA